MKTEIKRILVLSILSVIINVAWSQELLKTELTKALLENSSISGTMKSNLEGRLVGFKSDSKILAFKDGLYQVMNSTESLALLEVESFKRGKNKFIVMFNIGSDINGKAVILDIEKKHYIKKVTLHAPGGGLFLRHNKRYFESI